MKKGQWYLHPQEKNTSLVTECKQGLLSLCLLLTLVIRCSGRWSLLPHILRGSCSATRNLTPLPLPEVISQLPASFHLPSPWASFRVGITLSLLSIISVLHLCSLCSAQRQQLCLVRGFLLCYGARLCSLLAVALLPLSPPRECLQHPRDDLGLWSAAAGIPPPSLAGTGAEFPGSCQLPQTDKLARNRITEFYLALESCSWAASQQGWNLPVILQSRPGQCGGERAFLLPARTASHSGCQSHAQQSGWLSATHTSQPGRAPGLMILFQTSMDLMTVLHILRERPWALQSWIQHRWAEPEAIWVRSHCTNTAKQN